ncbi:hypothetical protein [Streptomyces sp. NPDC008150]|uniref:hypothetical protein n=1 Tax=Streptomyces sp. NPDC008150 TaxID=3364816 RepID=UPI0036E4D65B
MNRRQVRTMLRLMEGGGPVTVTSSMASVRKLAELGFVAQQFGYEYADARAGGGRSNALKMTIVPDPSPQAMARAAQNRAQYPDARDGVRLPPLVPDAVELLKVRIKFDLSRVTPQRTAGALLGLTVGSALLAVRMGADAVSFTVMGCIWAALVIVLVASLPLNRRRGAKFGARLHAAGFRPVTEKDGRVRYLPPGTAVPGQQVQTGPYGPYGAPAAGPQGAPPVPPQARPGAPAAPYAPAPYPAGPAPYAQPPGPYGQQPPYDPRQAPYGQAPQG